MNFESIWQQIEKDNLLGKQKSYNLWQQLIKTQNIKGDTAEIGVFKGHSSFLIKAILNRTHYCYDTFEGIAQSIDGVDVHKNGEFAANLQEVQNKLSNLVEYKVGLFPDTFTETQNFAFVHSDTDTYFGAKATFLFWDLLTPGGVLFFDDYHWPHCPGVEKAVDEWLMNHNCNTHVYQNQIAIQKPIGGVL